MKTLEIVGGLQVSALCLGTMSFGTLAKGEEAKRLFDVFRESGGNFLDTAHCYSFWFPGGLGASEQTVGEILRQAGCRDQIVIATKGAHPAVPPDYLRPDRYLSAEVIASDISESMKRMGLDWIDLFYLHRDDTRVPAGEVIEILNAEVKRGRIRAFGPSNWSVARIDEANRYARDHGLQPFSISEPQWCLAQTNATRPINDPALRFLMPEDEDWHRQSQLPIAPYSPTGNGYFATGGKLGSKTFDNQVSRERLHRVEYLSGELGCTPNQLALAVLFGRGFPVIPILGTTKVDHLKDGLGCLNVSVTPAQITWIWDGNS